MTKVTKKTVTISDDEAQVPPKAKGKPSVPAKAAKQPKVGKEPVPAPKPAPEARTGATVASPQPSPDVVQLTQAMKEPAKAPAKPTRVTKPKAEKPVKAPTGLEAAITVLQGKGEPMTCRDLVSQMLETGLWTTDGKTPAATINASIHKEIKSKGAASRFAKTGRGLFTLNVQKGA